VISKYKAEKNKSSKVEDDFDAPAAAKVAKRSAPKDEPTINGDYEFTESQIDRESKRNRKWYEQNEAKIMDAHRRGKVLFDLSGGAR
jgi:hypothetical protein